MTDCSLYLEALQKVFNEEFEKDMNELDQMEDHVFSVKHEKKMKKLIKRQKKPYFKLICTGGRRAACIIAAIFILSASALSVEAVRKAIFDFIISIFSDHNVITVEEGTDSGYPEKIEEEYDFSELPEGFEREYYEKTEASVSSYYSKKDKFIVLRQNIKATYKNIYDTEHMYNVQIIQELNQEFYIIEREKSNIIIWDNGKYVFTVSSNIDKNDMIEMCISTKIKDDSYNSS